MSLEHSYDFRGLEEVDRQTLRNREKSKRYYHKHRIEIIARRAVQCSCGRRFTGRGSHKVARKHAEINRHELVWRGRA